MLTCIPLIIPTGALIAAAIWDLRTRLIPDGLSIGLALAGLLWAVGEGSASLGLAALLGATTFMGGALLFAAGGLGGGDVKLAAAFAVWLTPGQLWDFLIFTALAGGVLCLGVATARFMARTRDAGAGAGLRAVRAATAPYAVAIAAGGVLALPWRDLAELSS